MINKKKSCEYMKKGVSCMKNKKILSIFCYAVLVVILVYIIYSNSPKTKVAAPNDTEFSINIISANKVVCIGKIELIEDSEYLVSVSSKSGSDIFVALSESENITDAQGVEWKQYHGTKGQEIEAKFLDDHIGSFYVYIGTKGDGLTEVKGKLSSIR